MKLLDPILHITDSITDVDKFSIITDTYITSTIRFLNNYKNQYSKEHQKLIIEANNLMDRIVKRKLYKFKKMIISDIKPINITNKTDIIHYNKIGFVSGNKKNPLEDIYFYDKSNKKKNFTINSEDISTFIPDIHQEHLVMFFTR